MIQIRRKEGEKLIELGGGANPKLSPRCQGGQDVCVDVRMCYDEQGRQTVDFVLDFNEPFGDAIQSDEFDAALAVFVLEHISWRNVPQFLKEVFRILKPGGKAVYIIPNTEAQMKYILSKPEWDGDESCMIFGDLDYPENSHKAAFSPKSITKLLQEAGYEPITTAPYGELQTDMVVEAVKPPPELVPIGTVGELMEKQERTVTLQEEHPVDNPPVSPFYDPIKLFDRDYFNGGRKHGGYKPFYWDDPRHEIIARNVMARKPKSVVEFGCGRGYIVKRLEDAGIEAEGFDVSNCCYLTRACDHVHRFDLTSEKEWPLGGWRADLCFSFAFLEHVPEDLLDKVIDRMSQWSDRGLHGITLTGQDDGTDKTRCTIKSKEWWQQKLPAGHEVYSLDDLRNGPFPEDYAKGDGKVKLNLGCVATMFHYGWTNMDILDMSQFAAQYQYKFQTFDAKKGLPDFKTGTVDMLYCSHMLEHLTYKEGLAFLRECRRVIKPDGIMRIILPDGGRFFDEYETVSGHEWINSIGDMNEDCANAPTVVSKLWAILGDHHHSLYDMEMIKYSLKEAGFVPSPQEFRRSKSQQMIKETLCMLPSVSLYVDATPLVDG